MRVLRIFHSAVVDAWRGRERALADLGVHVELLGARRWNEGGTDVHLVARSDERVTGVRTWGRHPALFVYDPRPLWRAMGQSWDVIDVHEEPFSLAVAEILLIRRLRRHSAPYVLYSAQNLDKRYPIPFRWFERWALRHAAGISVCNRAAAEIVQRKGLPGVPSVIPLGVDTSSFRPAATRVSTAETIEVGYVGRLAEHKGVAVLLEAIALDARLRLSCAGAGPMQDRLGGRSQELGIADRVRFVGPLTPEKLPDFYAGLDVLAVPSLTTAGWAEQFGRVAVEAMACGVPVVASDSGALPEVVGEGGLLVPPGDPGALAKGLLRLGTDAQLRDSARQAAVRQAAECSWARVAERYRAMYRLALHAPTASGPRGLEVVVVAYGSPELLRAALAPLSHLPVTVVDNSSSAEVRRTSVEVGACYLDAGYNGGFAAGVNLALRHRFRPDGDVLLLNPDAVVTPDAVAELQRALAADPHLASVAPRQVDADGAPARVEWPFPSPARSCLEAVGLGRIPAHRHFVIGSILLLRAEALSQVGGFDENFFLYAEETDWAYRAARLGWRHAVVPSATALHHGAATSTVASRREVHFYASQERFMRKHFGAWGWHVARTAQVFGSGLRAVVLRGEGAAAARHRLTLHLRGPVATEESRYPRERAPLVGAA